LNKTYFWIVSVLTVVAPAASVVLAKLVFASPTAIFDLTGAWFLFWALGARQVLAGLLQAGKPEFTARDIFHIQSREGDPIVRELGYANICMGAAAMISIACPEWRMCAAFTSGTYFGLAGTMHALKGAASGNERFALYSDVFIFVVIAAWFGHGLGAF
jgi:hypothetical protein